jgi:hypothetical protein
MKGHRSVGLSAGLAAGLVLLVGLWVGASEFAETPLLILGLTGGGYLSSAKGSSPAFFPEARLSTLNAWRGVLAGGGIVSLNASSRLYGYWDAGAIFHDQENLALEALLPVGTFTALLAAGLDGSALGTVEAPPYVQPGWNIGMRTTGEPWRAELQSKGHYLYRPQDVEDALYQAARLNLNYDPSISWGLTSALEAGWEYWPEYPMATAEPRQDVLLRAETGFEGLATRRLRPLRVWLERQALSGETLYVVSLGLDGRVDWTPNGKLFLVAEGTAAHRLANDPAEERWSFSAGLGMEYSF